MVARSSWSKMLKELMEHNGEKLDDIIYAYPKFDEKYDEEFCCGYGGVEGFEFTIWTKERVYFPAEYDGSEWVASVPRNPCDHATRHI